MAGGHASQGPCVVGVCMAGGLCDRGVCMADTMRYSQ